MGYRIPKPRPRQIAFALALACVAYVISILPITHYIDSHIARSWEFKLRDRLGISPRIDHRIVVFRFDEKTYQYLGTSQLDALEWATAIRNLKSHNPAQILIDHSFENRFAEDHLSVLIQQTRAGSASIYGGANSHSPSGRAPHPTNIGLFAKHGLTDSTSADGKTQALRFDAEGKTIFHLGLLASQNLEVSKETLTANNQSIPLDADGRVLVNRLGDQPPAYSLSLLLTGEAIEIPNQATIILESSIQESSAVVALANSVLTEEWLRPRGSRFFLCFLAFLCSWLLIRRVSTRMMGILTIAVSSVWVAAIFLAFTGYGYCIPWLTPMLCFLGVNSFATFLRVYRLSSQMRRLRWAVSDMTQSTELADKLLRAIPNFKATLKPAALLVVRIAHFDKTSARLSPEETIDILRESFHELQGIITENHGVVVKCFGPELIATFGYDYTNKELHSDYTADAVRCALEIQVNSVKKNLKRIKNGASILPLQVGVTNAQAVFGNIGSHASFKPTLASPDLDTAQHLTTACDIHRIMIAKSTFKVLPEEMRQQLDPELKLYQLRAHDKFEEAQEINLDSIGKKQFLALEHAMQAQLEVFRKDVRLVPSMPTSVQIVGGYEEEARLVNFSNGGVGLELPRYYGSEVQFRFRFVFDEPVPGLSQTFIAEVKWAKALSKGHYLHGLAFRSLSPNQCDHVFKALRAQLCAKTRSSVA